MASVSQTAGITEPARVTEPYVGPQPFKETDEIIFFGRETETQDLFSLIVSHGEVLLYAQSGAGKTSLLNAGVIPMLKRRGLLVRPIARVFGKLPGSCDLSQVKNIYTFSALRDWADPATPAGNLAGQSLSDFLGLPHGTTGADENLEVIPPSRRPQKPEVLIFDQFEEIFQSYPERAKEREKFFQQVGEALSRAPHLRIVFSIREDYLAQLKPYVSVLPERMKTQFRLERLRETNALKAVTGPLSRLTECRRYFAPNVAEKLVQDLVFIRIRDSEGKIREVQGEYVEPVQLAVVCDSLWCSLPQTVREITSDHLKTFGDAGEALSKFYESCIAEAAKVPGVNEAKLRRWFGETLVTSDGTRGTVFRGQNLTAGIPNAAVDILQKLHLIREEQRAGGSWYELSHDRFVAPVQQSNQAWLRKRGPAVEVKSRLEARAVEFINSGRQSDKLLKGTELSDAERWIQSVEADDLGYSPALANLVNESRLDREHRELRHAEAEAAAQKQRAEEQQQLADALRLRAEEQAQLVEAQRQLAEQARALATAERLRAEEQDARAAQKARRRRLQLYVLALAVAVLIGVALGYWRVAKNWSRQATEADSRRLALYAHDVVDRDPQLGILLALQAAKKAGDVGQGVTDEAENALREASQKFQPESVFLGHIGVIRDLAFSPDGNRVASASDDGTARIWDVTNGATQGKLLHTLSGHTDAVVNLAYDLTGRFIASGSRDNTIRIWDAQSGQPSHTIRQEGDVLALAFSADGTQLAAVMDHGKIKTWNILSEKTMSLSAKQIAAAFGPSLGSSLFLGERGTGEKLIFWNYVFNNTKHTLRGRPSAIDILAQSRDGRLIATASVDGTVKLWDGQTGQQSFTLPPQQGAITRLLFTADGEALATASDDGTVNVWNASSARLLYTLHGHRSALAAMAFSPDGKRLVTAGENDHLAKLWDISSARNSYSLFVQSSPLANLAVSPNGKQIVGMGMDRTMTQWDISTGTVLHTLDGEILRGSLVTFSRDGKFLAAGSRDGMLNAWDLDSGKPLFPAFKAHTGVISSMVFTADGNRIVTVGVDNQVNIWDVSPSEPLHKPLHSVTLVTSSTPGLFFILSPDGSHLAALSPNETLKIIDIKTGNESYTFPQKGFVTLCFSFSGQQLATWDPEGVKLWETSSGRLIHSFSDTAKIFYGLRFTADDRKLIAFNSNMPSSSAWIKMWDTDSGHLVHSIPQAPGGSVLAVNSDAAQLVTLTYTHSNISVGGAQQAPFSSFRYDVNAYPLLIRDLIGAAESRVTRSLSSQECHAYYLTGPQCKAADLVEEGHKLAQDGKIDDAVNKFMQAKALDRFIAFDPKVEAETEAKQTAVQANIEQGNHFVTQLAVLSAMSAYQKALAINPGANIAPERLNSVCWYGALSRHAKEVMQACDRAVAQAPNEPAFRDSRGLARALAGDTQGAIQDFQAFIKNSRNDVLAAQRREWIVALKAGQQPFTTELLDSLR